MTFKNSVLDEYYCHANISIENTIIVLVTLISVNISDKSEILSGVTVSLNQLSSVYL